MHSVYFLGIGGIGMSGIASILHSLGYQVRGSDLSDNYNVKRLQVMGIHQDLVKSFGVGAHFSIRVLSEVEFLHDIVCSFDSWEERTELSLIASRVLLRTGQEGGVGV